ncbi:hypothetical protein PYK79_07220 [Streptomyces sp. ID05-04B]|uniref:hypothetical protein n=1 Tax=Streptomyces sp. ID05-04B TaxID=3028661 RepID=UPI0029C5A03A|nr:hypothetical protein [Streptomyces sp. ID05-04B]MDX5563169.1 hypothetical protein [Streptomyces sp. ID05-04B]
MRDSSAAELKESGPPDGCARGPRCVNALGGGIDKAAILCALGRIPAPGGRLVMTAAAARHHAAPAGPGERRGR